MRRGHGRGNEEGGWLNDDRSTGIDTGEGKRKIIGKRGDKRVEASARRKPGTFTKGGHDRSRDVRGSRFTAVNRSPRILQMCKD